MRLEIFRDVVQRQAVAVQPVHVCDHVRFPVGDLIMPILRV